MLYVYVVVDEDGVVQTVNSSIEGAAVFAFGWGNGTLDGDAEWTLEAVRDRLDVEPSVRIEYDDGSALSIQRHGVFA